MIEFVGDMLTNPSGAVIRAIGIGGGGCNAIDNIKKDGVTGLDFIAANSDVQALNKNFAEIKVQVGKNTAKGLGVGGNPEVGKKCVEESLEEIKKHLSGSDMVFISAGMGGGTGTGGAPQVAKIAKELESLVVAVVTTPFRFEGTQKSKYAETGIEELKKNVDSIIVVSNQKLLEELDKNTPVTQAFKKVDEVLINASKGIVDIIQNPGFLNIDFADIRSVLLGSGEAIIGIGAAKGENRAAIATENALNSPLLEGLSVKGAKGILINITADNSFTMDEMETVTNIINTASGVDPYLKCGLVLKEEANDEFKVTVLATKFEKNAAKQNEITNKQQINNRQNIQEQARTSVAKEPETHQINFDNDYNPRNGRAIAQPRKINNPPTVSDSYIRVPTNSDTLRTAPRGSEELKKLDQPAYKRQEVQQKTVARTGTYDSENSIYSEAQEEAPRRISERPVFLRKIMD